MARVKYYGSRKVKARLSSKALSLDLPSGGRAFEGSGAKKQVCSCAHSPGPGLQQSPAEIEADVWRILSLSHLGGLLCRLCGTETNLQLRE